MPVGARSFPTSEGGHRRLVEIRVSDEAAADAFDQLVAALDSVPWSDLTHAYGPATDVPALLYAITVGDGPTRRTAWSELWGNVHHQGTVYAATSATVPFVATIANTEEHPDRVEALSFLREIALGDGDHADEVRSAVRPHAIGMVEALPRHPPIVRRAVVWLASAFPALVEQHAELVQLLPGSMRATWDEVLARVRERLDPAPPDNGDLGYPTDEALDREDELERWALAGWTDDGAGA